MNTVPFPGKEFDDWAPTYDSSVQVEGFPFSGYRDVLAEISDQARPYPGVSVLDLGTGTGNLASSFSRLECRLWCTDFSLSMLRIARQKLPRAQLILHDLHDPLPLEMDQRFDRIISAYVFHHFEPAEKVRILCGLIPHLVSTGMIIIGDIAFHDPQAMEKVKDSAGCEWEDESYWIVSESTTSLEKAGFKVNYIQVSSCAGVFSLQSQVDE